MERKTHEWGLGGNVVTFPQFLHKPQPHTMIVEKGFLSLILEVEMAATYPDDEDGNCFAM